MGGIFSNIKNRFRQRDILIQLILINAVVFLVLAFNFVITKLFLINSFEPIQYIGVPENIELLMKRPWTLLTYMFSHQGFFHIFFNMLLLYWFGQIFLGYFNSKNLRSLYLLGGLAGALIYILAFNTIPLYKEMHPSFLIGASASVMAIIFAVAFYNPLAEIGLLFFGTVKIIYIAIFLFVLDFLSLGDTSNPGGHIAHIGGAILGFCYAKLYLKGINITSWLTNVIDWVGNLFKPRSSKPKMKVKYKSSKERDYDYNKRKHQESEEIDRILDKIKTSGYSSLTEQEKRRLFDASKK